MPLDNSRGAVSSLVLKLLIYFYIVFIDLFDRLDIEYLVIVLENELDSREDRVLPFH